jgi:hypothetical protein
VAVSDPGVTPVPESGMLRLGFEALQVIERLPLADPAVVGVNVTLKLVLDRPPESQISSSALSRYSPIQEDLKTQATAAKASLRYGLEAGVGTGRDGDGVAEGR